VVVLLKVPQVVSDAQAVSTRFIALLVWLMGSWSCGCLYVDVNITLSCVAYMLTCSRGGCS
jgi:hypothetical protein